MPSATPQSNPTPPEATIDDPAPAAKNEHLTGLRLYLLLSSLTLVTFLVLLDTSIMGTAIPRITSQFHSLPDVGWYIGAYTLAIATLQPLSGKLYTHFPIKPTFILFVALFALGSLLCGAAPSSSAFIAGRTIAGLGSSGIFNGAMTMLAGAAPRDKSPLYTGMLLGIGQMGIVAGPLVGGALTEHASWRWCFYMNLPLGGIAAASIAALRVPEGAAKQPFSLQLVVKVLPEMDLFGFALFVPAAVMFLLALQFGSGNTFAWKSATVIGLFCGAGVMAGFFVLWEMKMGERAMLPGTLLKKRAVWASCVFGTCITCCMLVASNWLPTYFQAVKGDGPSLSGVHILPSILSQLLFAMISGAAVSKTGYYLPWATFSGIVTSVGNGLLSTFGRSTSISQWIGYQIVVGAGRGAGMQMSIIAIQNAVSTTQYPVAVAMSFFFQNLGAAIVVVISNTIFAQTLTSTIPTYAPSVSPQAALDAGSGAAAVRHLVAEHEDELSGVLRAYSQSLRNVFYLLVGVAGVAVAVSGGMGWKDVRKEKKEEKVPDDVAREEESVREKEGSNV